MGVDDGGPGVRRPCRVCGLLEPPRQLPSGALRDPGGHAEPGLGNCRGVPVGVPKRPFEDAGPGCQQPWKVGDEIRPGPAETLHHCVRGERDVAVLARGDVRKQFVNRGVCLLHVIHQHQLQPFALCGQEAGLVLEDLAGSGDDACGVEGLGHPQVQDVPVLRVQGCCGDPVGPAALAPQLFKVGCGPAGFDDAVKKEAHFVPEAPGLQGRFQVLRPRQVQAGQAVALQQLPDDQVLFRAGEEARRPRERKDPLGLRPADQVKGIGGPGPGGRGAQAPVQPCRKPVPERVGRQPSRCQNEDPFRIHAVLHAHGGRQLRSGRWTYRCRVRRAPARVPNHAAPRQLPAGPLTAPEPLRGPAAAEEA